MIGIFDLKKQQADALHAAEAILNASGDRGMSESETEQYNNHMNRFRDFGASVRASEEQNSIRSLIGANGTPKWLHDPDAADERGITQAAPGVHPRAAQFRGQFASWMNSTLRAIGGGVPQMEAAAPTGPVSIGTGTGVDSIGITVPTEVLPYLPSYYNLDSFALAGATQIFTEHTRPLVKPILSAGADDSTFAENSAPTTSQPFGLSSFTFNGTKYSRLVLASYEALMNSELPLQEAILDELLASLATTFTKAITTAFVSALTAPPGVTGASPLAVGVGGSTGSVYTSMIDLRHSIPPRFDLPTNKFMLSRQTLAAIRDTRATSSGVPMFSPDGTKLFDRDYVLNDYLDTASGAGVGFVAFGSFADGAWIRKTPVMTRVFMEKYSESGQLGFRVMQWLDSHFLAELAGAAQPPTFQPIYYTNTASEK